MKNLFLLIILLFSNFNILSMSFARRAASNILKPKVLLPLTACYQLRNYNRRNRELDADKKAAIALKNVNGGINYFKKAARNSPSERLARENLLFKYFFDFTKTHPYYDQRVEQIRKIAQEYNFKIEERQEETVNYSNLTQNQKCEKLFNKFVFIIDRFNWPNGKPNFYFELTDKGQMPMAVPFLHTVYIPIDAFSLPEKELDFIMAHEIAHILQFEEMKSKFKIRK